MTTIVHFSTAGDNNMPTSSENANLYHTDFLGIDGVNGEITNPASGADTGSMAVVAQGTPDMTVAVSAGQAYVTATPTGEAERRVRVNLSSSTNVTIAANSTGSTKYDLVYIKLPADTLADPPATGNWTENTVYLTERMSSSGQTLTDTTNTLLLAEVTVTDGETAIANDEITDKRWQTAPKGGVVLRQTVAAYDATATAEADWTDWDLSSIVPEGARSVIIYTEFEDNTAGSYIAFRKNGDTAAQFSFYNRALVASQAQRLIYEVRVDSSRILEKKVNDAGGSGPVTSANTVITGWRF